MVVVRHTWHLERAETTGPSEHGAATDRRGLCYILICYERPAGAIRALTGVLAQRPAVDLILIVDNSYSEAVQQALSGHFDGVTPATAITYVRLANNPGPAGAAWYGYKYARDAGYEYAAVIDDNQFLEADDVACTLVRLLDAHKDTAVGIGHTGAIWTRWGTLRPIPTPGPSAVTVTADVVGGAFMMLRVRGLPDSALPNPLLFFGYFDTEHSLRLSRRHGQLLVAAQPLRRYRLNRRNTASSASPPSNRIQQRREVLLAEMNETQLWQTYYRNRNYVWFVSREYARWDQAALYAARFLAKSLLAIAVAPRQGAHFAQLGIVGLVDGSLGKFTRRVTPRQRDIVQRPTET